jgi:hypothetical protein
LNPVKVGLGMCKNAMPNTRRFLSASLKNTAEDTATKSMQAASRAGSQSEALLTSAH